MDEYKEVYNDGTIRLTRSAHGWGMQMPLAATALLVKEGKKAPWVEAKLEDIGQVKAHTWEELYEFAVNYQLRDPRLIVAILLLARQPELLRTHHLG